MRETWRPKPPYVDLAFGACDVYAADVDNPSWAGKWKPSIHMPRDSLGFRFE